MKNLEWKCGYAHIAKTEKDKYYLEYGGIDTDTFDNFSGYVYIKKCNEACNYGKWLAVPQNPFTERYDTEVILGGSCMVVAKKVLKQVEKWLKEAKSGEKQKQHKIQEQSTGEKDSLPF